MANAPVTVRLSAEEKKDYQESAKKLDMSLAELLRTGAGLLAGFDRHFWERLNSFSKAMNIPKHLVLERLVISWMARQMAKEYVFGKKPGGEILYEFMVSSAGPIQSEVVLKNLKKVFIQEYEQIKKAKENI